MDWQPLLSSTAQLPPYAVRFVTGFLLMNAGFITCRPLTFALYSKLIAPQYQGTYLGYMVAGGSAARTLGPFVAVFVYFGVRSTSGENVLALFGSVGLLHILCLVLVARQWSKLVPSINAEAKSREERSSSLV